ncbi:MAG: hypothetical protein DRH50_17130 [Deltaproteobacteria bacterium]|nr:MAG: hypothetical protein DRH50_17130 [Deltaproteobacteria bacterium]
MSKTFPVVMQSLFEIRQDIHCLELRIWNIGICFGFRIYKKLIKPINLARQGVTTLNDVALKDSYPTIPAG